MVKRNGLEVGLDGPRLGNFWKGRNCGDGSVVFLSGSFPF
jgi:hypothetical protein